MSDDGPRSNPIGNDIRGKPIIRFVLGLGRKLKERNAAAGVGVNVESNGVPLEYPRIISIVPEGPAHRFNASEIIDHHSNFEHQGFTAITIAGNCVRNML